ncbi:ribosome-binding factor A [Umbribacter vaginalis]|jgi:hypothetical protein|nr:ribosome-binding factor A [Coriobacteriales bacterium DNF00809]
MKQKASSKRVNEQARQVIAETLLFEISDPRLRLVTVTDCEVSFDRSVCNVYVSADSASYDTVLDILKRATPKFRSSIGKKLSWRVVPELRFMLDTSVDQAQAITQALMRERKRREQLNNLQEDGGAHDE